MKSPFKFLDAYTLEDRASFFGRVEEEKQLYNQLRNTSLTLLYGLSGTGKTSLVQCGLSNFYDGPDWHPFLIRRGENINDSIEDKLLSVLEGIENISDLEGLVYEVFIRYSRPVYLIFDQFEELFTVISHKSQQNEKEKEEELAKVIEERIKFFKDISLLLKRNLPCKIIIIIREEFLGQLYEFEPYLPNLFDFRLRVEPMNTTKLNEVLTGTFNHFNVKADSEIVQSVIATNLIKGNATSQLTYLQVYLDKLWKIAYVKQYGDQGEVKTLSSVEFTEEIIAEVGDVNNVLNSYLEEQEQAIAEKLGVNNELIRKILDNFVTDDGTKKPIVSGSNLLNPNMDIFTPIKLEYCLEALQEARLIRKDKQFYELAHDALAGILDKKRTGEQRLIKNLTASIRTSYELYTDQSGGGLLNEENVSLFDQFNAPILKELKQDNRGELIQEYIETSRKANEAERNSLVEKNRRLKMYLWGIIIFISIAAYAVYNTFNSSIVAKKSNSIANAIISASYSDKINPIQGLRLLEKIQAENDNEDVKKFIEDKLISLFNSSWTHLFREKRRFNNVSNCIFSNDSKWIILKKSDSTSIILETGQEKTPDFLRYENNIKYAVFSNDSKLLLTRSIDSTLKVWDLSLHKTIDFLNLTDENIFASFSSNSKWIITQNQNKKIFFFNLTVSKKYEFINEKNNLKNAIFSEDGKWLIAIFEENKTESKVKIWNIDNGKSYDHLSNEKDIIGINILNNGKFLISTHKSLFRFNSYKIWNIDSRKETPYKIIKFSEDGNWLAIRRNIFETIVLDLKTGKIPNFLGKGKYIISIEFSKDGKWLVTGDIDKKVKVWNLRSGKLYDFLKNEKEINYFDIFGNSKWLITRNFNNTATIWEMETGKRIDFLSEERNTFLNAIMSQNGEWLITKNFDNTLKIWDVINGKKAEFLKGEKNIIRASFSKNGKWLITQNIDNTFKLWDLNNKNIPCLLKGGKNINEISISNSNQLLITKYEDDSIGILKYNLNQPLPFFKTNNNISTAFFSNDGNWLVTTTMDYGARIWNTKTGESPPFLKSKMYLNDVIFSTDSKLMFAKGDLLKTKIWNVNDDFKTNKINNNSDNIVSKDGKFLINNSNSLLPKLTDISTGNPLNFINIEEDIVDVFQSLDNNWLIAVTYNFSSKIWYKGILQNNFLIGEKDISDVIFSKDNKLLITKSSDTRVKVWNLESKKIVEIIKGEVVWKNALFSNDGKWLAIEKEDNSLIIFDILKGNIRITKNANSPCFSKNSTYLSVIVGHKVVTQNLEIGKPVQVIYLNKKPKQIQIADNRYLFIVSGKAIIKTDLIGQKGYKFSYGDGEELDYTYEEIEEWKKVFGEQYLLPLDEEIKKKYKIEDNIHIQTSPQHSKTQSKNND